MRRNGLLRTVMPLSIAAVVAVASALIMISTSQPGGIKGATERVTGAGRQPDVVRVVSEPPSRLIAEDQRAFANEPISLAVRVEHSVQKEILLLEGLAPGTTLSAGVAKSPSSWQVPYDSSHELYLYAPKDFIGVMHTALKLLGPDKRLLDSRIIQLKWIARQPMPPPNAESPEATAASTRVGAGHAALPAPKTPVPEVTANFKMAQTSVPGQKTASPEGSSVQVAAAHPMPPMEPSEGAILLQKGRDLLASGDIAAARVAFRRSADAGNPEAAMALASTYNPDYLAAHQFLGMRGDRATARALYQRAKELGAADAERFILQMQRTR
jgi:hypothetical protein